MVSVRGVANVDSIFALMIFLIFFAFVSNYVLQMSGGGASAVDLKSATERAYLEILEEGSLLDAGGRLPVSVPLEGQREDYFWVLWNGSGIGIPSAYDPVFGETVALANLSQGSAFVLSGAAGNAAGDISFDGSEFSNSRVSLSIEGMDITGFKIGNDTLATSIFLSPQLQKERESNVSLRVKVAGGNYSWSFFSGLPELALDYEATGVSGLVDLSIVLDPSLTSVYTNGVFSCVNFSQGTDFIDVYGSRGIAVSGEDFSASCSDGVLRITRTVALLENESRRYSFRLYAHEGDFSSALSYRGLPPVLTGLPFRTRMFVPAAVSGIDTAYCKRIGDSVNPNLGLWLSFETANGTYECMTESAPNTQDIVVSKKPAVYSDGNTGALYVRSWYK